MRFRLLLGAAGVALATFGVFRLLTEVSAANLGALGAWLLGALVVHDGVVAPLTGTIGFATRAVPPRARTYVQAGLTVGALITVIALPLIHRQGRGPAAKALLRQDYRASLAVLLGIVAAATVMLYLARVVRERRRARATNDRPREDHDSSGTQPVADA